MEDPFGRTGTLPRRITPDILWTGRCIPSSVPNLHAHYAFYVVRGAEKVVLVDTGHPMHAEAVTADVEAFLVGRPVDYVFPTHSELPHSGMMAWWLRRYPASGGGGGHAGLAALPAGVRAALPARGGWGSPGPGDRKLVFLPPVWRDLPDTLWAFDTKDRVLFLSDACAYFHAHVPGQCDHFSSEIAPPDVAIMQDFNDKALHWPKFTDSRPSFPEMDEMMTRLRPRLLAGAHGCVVDTPERTLPLFKAGIAMGPVAA